MHKVKKHMKIQPTILPRDWSAKYLEKITVRNKCPFFNCTFHIAFTFKNGNSNIPGDSDLTWLDYWKFTLITTSGMWEETRVVGGNTQAITWRKCKFHTTDRDSGTSNKQWAELGDEFHNQICCSSFIWKMCLMWSLWWWLGKRNPDKIINV